jgi:flagellin-like protein
MKKMWKKNNKAVSPVIATILMVAITVVLAAVLYVMVMGFGGGGSNETPSGSLTYVTTSTGYRVSIASISESDVLVSQVMWLVDGAQLTEDELDDNVTWAGAGTYVTAGSFLVCDDGYVELDSGSHTISLLYTETNNNIASLTINVP